MTAIYGFPAYLSPKVKLSVRFGSIPEAHRNYLSVRYVPFVASRIALFSVRYREPNVCENADFRRGLECKVKRHGKVCLQRDRPLKPSPAFPQ